MDSVLSFSRSLRRRIQKLDRKTRDADLRVRCRVLLKVDQGMNRNAAAREVGCVPSTAWCIVRRFQLWGEASLFDGRCENGDHKVDEDIRAGIWRILVGTPRDHGYDRPTWTLELLSRVVAEQLSVLLSVGHLWKVLRRMKARVGRPRPVVACPWKAAARKRRIEDLRRLEESLPRREVLVYLDEVDIHLNPRIGRDWMLPGVQRIVVTPGQNEKRYIAGAYDPRRQRMTYVEGDRKASWLFLNLLEALQSAYRWAGKIHVILDNYIIHKSVIVQTALQRMGKIRLHFLPPYCPNENRIEREWLDLHATVTRNHQCRTMPELMRAVRTYLDSRFWAFRGLCVS